jgi:hypothetical protein
VAVPLVASADKKKKEKPSSKRNTAGPCKKEKPTDDGSGTGAPNYSNLVTESQTPAPLGVLHTAAHKESFFLEDSREETF